MAAMCHSYIGAGRAMVVSRTVIALGRSRPNRGPIGVPGGAHLIRVGHLSDRLLGRDHLIHVWVDVEHRAHRNLHVRMFRWNASPHS